MALSNMAEESKVFKYSALTTKVVQVLYQADRQEELTPRQKVVLQRGAELIAKIIEGSTLVEVETEQFGYDFTPSEEGLSAYGYALTTIEALDFEGVPDSGDFLQYFKDLHKKIETLTEDKKENGLDIFVLRRFFSALGTAFRGAIDSERYQVPQIEESPV